MGNWIFDIVREIRENDFREANERRNVFFDIYTLTNDRMV